MSPAHIGAGVLHVDLGAIPISLRGHLISRFSLRFSALAQFLCFFLLAARTTLSVQAVLLLRFLFFYSLEGIELRLSFLRDRRSNRYDALKPSKLFGRAVEAPMLASSGSRSR